MHLCAKIHFASASKLSSPWQVVLLVRCLNLRQWKTQWASDQTGLSNRFIKHVEALSEAKPPLTFSGDPHNSDWNGIICKSSHKTLCFLRKVTWHTPHISTYIFFKPNIYIFHEFRELKIVAVAESWHLRRCLGVDFRHLASSQPNSKGTISASVAVAAVSAAIVRLLPYIDRSCVAIKIQKGPKSLEDALQNTHEYTI